jgi:uncharacterized protein (TIGR02271 family)
VEWTPEWRKGLARQRLCGTGTTAGEVVEACPGLNVEEPLGGPKGGDLRVEARIAAGGLDALVRFPDPEPPHPHEADVQAPVRISLLADIPVALSRASVDHLAEAVFVVRRGRGDRAPASRPARHAPRAAGCGPGARTSGAAEPSRMVRLNRSEGMPMSWPKRKKRAGRRAVVAPSPNRRRRAVAAERLDGTGEDEAVLPLAEEALRVGKRRVETGRVRVSVATEAEDRLVRETLRTERVEVERVAVGRELAEGEPVPAARREDDGTLVVPVLEEVLVVERRLVLREEVRLRTVAAEETVERPVTLRRQRAEVERLPPDPTGEADGGDDPGGASPPPGRSSL